MKFFAVLISVFMANIAFAKEAPSIYAQLSDMYEDVDYNGLLIENHYYIAFHELSLDNGDDDHFCGKPENFKNTTSKDIAKMIRSDVGAAIEILEDGTDGYFDRMEALYELTDLFHETLKNDKLELCVYESIPSYSGGHEERYVKVNGVLKFVFEIGYPD